jgi:hypothetical protein
MSATLPDVLWLEPGELAMLAPSGLLRDLTNLPGEAALEADELPVVGLQTHLTGRRYGVAASLSLKSFMYNREHLQLAGTTNPPATFDDLRDLGIELGKDRIGNYAFYWTIKERPGIFAEEYAANQVPMFDANLEPTFASAGLYQSIIKWRLAALYDWKIGDPRGFVSIDVDESFPHGWSSLTWAPFENLKSWQIPGRYRAGGKLTNALSPSLTAGQHGAIATVQLHAVSGSASSPEQAWAVSRFLGGDDGFGEFAVPRLRWRRDGLGFAFRSLLADRNVRQAATDWCDYDAYVHQLDRALPPPGAAAGWYRVWDDFANLQTGLLLRREQSPVSYLAALTQRWQALRAAWQQAPQPPVL